MINPQMIKWFLSRPLPNYDWVKGLSDAKLDKELAALNIKLNGIKLWRHQKQCLLLLNKTNRFIFHINMGGGKTLLSLMFLKYKKDQGEKPRAIVFVPYVTSVETWVEEVGKYLPSLHCVPLTGTTKENRAHLSGPGDLFVICYQSAVAMLSRRTAQKWRMDANAVRDQLSGFNFVVCDEIHKTKSQKSLTFEMCRAISAQAKWAIGLTGTPFGKDLQDLWSQFYLIDFGETLGKTLTFYRNAFFTSKVNYWGGWEWQFKRELLPQLQRMIKNRSIHYPIDEFYDMPAKEYIPKYFALPQGVASYAQQAIAEIKQGVKASDYQLVESSFLILRQLSSAFMTFKGEDTERLHIKFDTNPKLEALIDLIEQMPPQCKMVVFHHFVYTNELISAALHDLKIPHARIYGKSRDPIAELRRFKTDDKCRVLVINSRSGSSSLNLQGANYVVFFEQPDSPIDRQQAEARCWRPGQSKRVFIYDLLVNDTVDAKMMYSNRAGTNLLKALLEGNETL